MNLEQAIEVLRSYYKWMRVNNKEIESLSKINEAIDVISNELQNILNSIKCFGIDSNIPNKTKNNFQPKDGDFVKLISEKFEDEIIFKCIDNMKIWYYAITDLKHDCSWLAMNWSPDEYEILPSDGSHILAALKKAGKRWNAEKKCIENDDIL